MSVLWAIGALVIVAIHFWDERLKNPARMCRELRSARRWIVALVVSGLVLPAILNLDGVFLSN